MARFGFAVIRSEQKDLTGSLFDEGNKTFFVEFETELPRYPEKVQSCLYYGRNFAKWNLTNIEELESRFPKSFKYLDSGDEYNRAFAIR